MMETAQANESTFRALLELQERAPREVCELEARFDLISGLSSAIVLLFSLATAILGIQLVYAWVAQNDLRLGVGGLVTLAAVFLSRPLHQVKQAASDRIQAAILGRSWSLSLNLLLLAMDAGGMSRGDEQAERSRESIRSTAMALQELSLVTVRGLAEHLESPSEPPTDTSSSTNPSEDRPSGAKPEVKAVSFDPPDAGSTRLIAVVNPSGRPTQVTFALTPTTGDGRVTVSAGPINGTVPVQAKAVASGLVKGAEYSILAVAENDHGSHSNAASRKIRVPA